MERLPPQMKNALSFEQWDRAVRGLRKALKDLDDMRRGLENARYNLGLAVEYAPAPVRRDFCQFWAIGGCTERQYVDWLKRKRPAAPAARRKHLRLVVDNSTARFNKILRYRPEPRSEYEPGPDAA